MELYRRLIQEKSSKICRHILENAKNKAETPKEIFEVLYCMKFSDHFVGPFVTAEEIKKYIEEKKGQIMKEAWRIIETQEKQWTFEKKYCYNQIGKEKSEKIRLALGILLELEGFDQLSTRILKDCKENKFDFFEIYTIFCDFAGEGKYFHSYGKPRIITPFFDWIEIPIFTNFLYKIAKYIFKRFQIANEKNEIGDYIILNIEELYHGSPAKISEKEMESLLEGNKNSEIINFIKENYRHNSEKKYYQMDIRDMKEISNDDLQKFYNAMRKLFFNKEISEFLQTHRLSYYGQLKNIFNSTQSVEEDNKKMQDFIAKNLSKFSYKDMLDKIVYLHISQDIHFAVYIATLLVGPGKLLEDIKKNYEEGNIKFDELNYLSYALQSMSFYLGVHANPILHKGLHSYVKEQAAVQSKKWWQFWKKK